MPELFANRCSRIYFERQIHNGVHFHPAIQELHQKDWYPGIKGVNDRNVHGTIYLADIQRRLAINGQMLPQEDKNSTEKKNVFLSELLTPDQANQVRWYYDQRLYYTAETLLAIPAGRPEEMLLSPKDKETMWPVQTLPEDTGAGENIYVSPYDGRLRLRSTRRFRSLQFSDRPEKIYRSLFGYAVQELLFVENQGFRLSYLDFVGEMNFIRLTTAAVLADRDKVREALSIIKRSKPINQTDSIRYATIFRNIHTRHICMDELDKIRTDLDTYKKENRDHNLQWMQPSHGLRPTFSYKYLDKNTIQGVPLQEWLEQCVDAYEDPSYAAMSKSRKVDWNRHVRKAYEEIYHRQGLRVNQHPLLTWQQHVYYPAELKSVYRGVERTH